MFICKWILHAIFSRLLKRFWIGSNTIFQDDEIQLAAISVLFNHLFEMFLCVCKFGRNFLLEIDFLTFPSLFQGRIQIQIQQDRQLWRKKSNCDDRYEFHQFHKQKMRSYHVWLCVVQRIQRGNNEIYNL